MENCGIYKITNKVNNKIYIGSSSNISSRYYHHLVLLRKDKHFNIHLQRAYNKYGEDTFEFSMVKECDDSELTTMEEYYIKTLNALDDNFGYNINPNGDRPPSWLGKHHKEETKLKISKSQEGRVSTQHMKDVASLTHKGKTISQEQKDILKEKNSGEGNPMFGRTPYEIWVEKYGKEVADQKEFDRIEKLREKNTGENNPMFGITPYDIWLEKYGKEEADIRYEKWRNRIITDETREKMSKVNLGRKASDKTKKLQSDKRKGELNPSCKIKNTDVIKIQEMLENNISIKDISKMYNVCTATIRNIKKGKRKI